MSFCLAVCADHARELCLFAPVFALSERDGDANPSVSPGAA
jgi:hypothetical protein